MLKPTHNLNILWNRKSSVAKIARILYLFIPLVYIVSLVGIPTSSVIAAPPIAYVADIGTNTIKNSSIADLVVTTTADVVAGDDIIIAYATDPSQDLNISVSDSVGNKYQQAAMAINVGNLRTFTFAAYNVTALPSGGTITITQTVYSATAVAARAAVVSVFRGLAPSGALEQTNTSSGSSTTPSSGAATTIQADQLLIGVVGTEGPGTDTAGTWSNSFIEGPRAGTTATTTDAEITVSMGYLIVSAANPYTAAKSGITSRDWAASIATFKTTDAGISYIGDIGRAQSKVAGTSLVVTTNAGVTAGDDIMLTFAADPAATVSSVVDSAGNTYNQVVEATNATNVKTTIFAAYNVIALSSGGTITINHASVTARAAVVSVFRGLANTGALDQTHTGTGSTSTVSSGATSTTIQAGELLIGAVGLEGPNVDAPSVWQNSFTYGPRLGTSYGSGSGDATDITAQMGWRIVGTTGAYTAQIVNLNTTRDWAADIATFKAALNEPPVLNPIGNKGINELVELTFTATATDDGLPSGTLVFSLADGTGGLVPTGASINPTTGVFTWTPTEAQGPGAYTFDVCVSDGALSDCETITVTVIEVNVAPVLGAIGNKSVNELVLLTFAATATDTDIPVQTLTFSLAGTVPTGASITTGGVFTWTPTEAQGPGGYTFDVCVSDGALIDCETITVTVSEVNLAPVLGTIGNKTVVKETLLTFTATATDADIPVQMLNFSLAGTVPTGASITTGGIFTWKPTGAQGPGGYTFDVCVSDSALSDCETITVTVLASPLFHIYLPLIISSP
jgi:hypothetical protein